MALPKNLNLRRFPKTSKPTVLEAKKPINVPNNHPTTIKIMEETKLRLDKLKEYERESYDQILRKMLYIMNVCRQDPLKAKKVLENIGKTMQREKQYKKSFY